MKRQSRITVVTGFIVVMAASPLFAANKKLPAPAAPATSVGNKTEEPAKTTREKTSASNIQTQSRSDNRRTTSGQRNKELEQPDRSQDSRFQQSATPAATTDAIQLDWVSINHGGATEVVSGNLKMGLSIAQTVAGEVSAGDLKMGLGFWYGGASSVSSCECTHQADLDGDGFPTSLDLGWLVDIAYAGQPDFPNPGCPTSRGDFDNNGFVDIIDVAWMVDFLYASGTVPCDPCNPVQSVCVP